MNDTKLVCFDVDDTLISQNSWYVLNLALGMTPEEDLEMYEAYGRGDLSYDDWTAKLSALYRERGLATRENVTAALSTFKFKEGAEDLVRDLQSKGYEIALVSGSFDTLTRELAQHLGVKYAKGNTTLRFSDTGEFLDIESGGDEIQAKVGHLENFCNELGIKIEQCVCIGDGANDVEMFKKTGKGITFTDAPEHVQAAAWKTVAQLSDIKEIL